MQLTGKRWAIVLGLCVLNGCVVAGQTLAPALGAHKASEASPSKPGKGSPFAAQHFEQAAISPDGQHVAWVEVRADAAGSPTGKQDIYVGATSGAGKPMRISAAAAPHDEGDVAWSHDSKQIAFLSDAAKGGQLQLYVSNLKGSLAQKLTNVKGFLAGPRWSPDGKSIAVLFTENATRDAGPLVAETAETGVIKDAFFEQRLAIVDLASGSLRQITPADTYIYEYDWAPDGKWIALTAAKGNGDSNWYVAGLYAVTVGSGEMHSISKPKLQIARPAVSPDGQSIAFIEGLMSDEPSVGGDVYVISRDGATPRNLTPDRKASAADIAWSSDGQIIDMENADEESSIVRIDPATGKIDSLYRAPQMMTSGFWSTSISLTPDGKTAAFVRSSFQDPPEVWAGPIGKWQQVTHRNEGVKPEWGEAKSLHWTSEGFNVQGWLIYPKDFDPAKKYPMVVQVHGGPGLSAQSNWPSAHSYGMALPAHNYFLLLAESARKLWTGRSIHTGQCEGLRLRRLARHYGRRGRSHSRGAD